MLTEELLKQIRIPPEYVHVWDASPSDIVALSVRLESWKKAVPSSLRDLASHLEILGNLPTEEQSLLVIYVAQYVGYDPWVSNDARSQAERTLFLAFSRIPARLTL